MTLQMRKKWQILKRKKNKIKTQIYKLKKKQTNYKDTSSDS